MATGSSPASRSARRLRLYAQGLPPGGHQEHQPLRRAPPVHSRHRQHHGRLDRRDRGPSSPPHEGQVQVQHPEHPLKVLLDLLTVKFLLSYSTRPGLRPVRYGRRAGRPPDRPAVATKRLVLKHSIANRPLLLLAAAFVPSSASSSSPSASWPRSWSAPTTNPPPRRSTTSRKPSTPTGHEDPQRPPPSRSSSLGHSISVYFRAQALRPSATRSILSPIRWARTSGTPPDGPSIFPGPPNFLGLNTKKHATEPRRSRSRKKKTYC